MECKYSYLWFRDIHHAHSRPVVRVGQLFQEFPEHRVALWHRCCRCNAGEFEACEKRLLIIVYLFLDEISSPL